jgi:hypothetical protein
MSHDPPSFINVRFAAYSRCSTNICGVSTRRPSNNIPPGAFVVPRRGSTKGEPWPGGRMQLASHCDRVRGLVLGMRHTDAASTPQGARSMEALEGETARE